MAYRTSVLNDFSVVSKAFFRIYKSAPKSGSMDSLKKIKGFSKVLGLNFTPISEILPVQINPTSLSFKYGNDKIFAHDKIPIEPSTSGGIQLTKPQRSKGEAGSLGISLIYDIYDEYYVKTMGGALSTDFSLMSETATSLKTLSDYAGNNNNYYTLFIWGEIEYFGYLSDVDITYNAFSRWGTPLKADATITIEKQPLAYNNDGIEISPTNSSLLGTDPLKLKAYKKTEELAILASQASR